MQILSINAKLEGQLVQFVAKGPLQLEQLLLHCEHPFPRLYHPLLQVNNEQVLLSELKKYPVELQDEHVLESVHERQPMKQESHNWVV